MMEGRRNRRYGNETMKEGDERMEDARKGEINRWRRCRNGVLVNGGDGDKRWSCGRIDRGTEWTEGGRDRGDK